MLDFSFLDRTQVTIMGHELKAAEANPKSQFYEYNDIPSFARPYLETYYACAPSEDEREISKFMLGELKRLGRQFDLYVEIGCGGTLHHSVPMVPYVRSIVLTDYLEDARREAQLWASGDPNTFSWDHYIAKSLEHEGFTVNDASIAGRRTELRTKIRSIIPCDVRSIPIVDLPLTKDTLFGMFFVSAEVGGDLPGWTDVMRCVCATIPVGGHLFISALRGMSEYVLLDPSGNEFRRIRCAPVDETHFADLLPKLGFSNPTVKAHLIENPDVHIPGVVMVSATKSHMI